MMGSRNEWDRSTISITAHNTQHHIAHPMGNNYSQSRLDENLRFQYDEDDTLIPSESARETIEALPNWY